MMEELQQMYNQVIEKPLQVFTIFKEFFGEDRVDMQGIPTLDDIPTCFKRESAVLNSYIRSNATDIFILVHFPRVKVTNEYDKYTYINHLYAKVSIDLAGKLKFKFSLNRAEYTVQHFTNNYMHSHVSDIPVGDFTAFQTPCTGSGPINNTICSLIHSFDEDLWRLFCLELDKFVQVESVAGVPYHKLEQLGDRTRSSYRVTPVIQFQDVLSSYDLAQRLSMVQIAKFTKYVIDHNVLKFAYIADRYTIAMTPMEFTIAMSNAFIEWYNKEYHNQEVHFTVNELLNAGIINKRKFINGQLFREDSSSGRYDYSLHVGKRICTFKGEEICLSFSDIPVEDSSTDNYVIILKDKIANFVATTILNVVNFKYGNNTENPNEKGVCFL